MWNYFSFGKIARRLLLTIIVFAICESGVRATPVLDQIYFDPVANIFGGASVQDSSFRRAQTITVGLAGLLNSVDMMNFGPLIPGQSMRILSTIGGVPTFTVLASTNSHGQTADGWTIWDLSASHLSVVPGEVLAMDMLFGEWVGHVPGEYAPGADFFLNVSAGFPNFTRNFLDHDPDWFFRTFVGEGSRIPEPTPLCLLLASPLALLVWKLRSK